MKEMQIEEEEVVIVGGGVAGLATSLGLHRLGIRSLVLESSEQLRSAGFAFGMWRNAWKAMEALGIATTLREKHDNIQVMSFMSIINGIEVFKIPDVTTVQGGGYELRCVNRKVLLETICSELPEGTIRYSSKVVSIQNDGHFKSLLLADGTSIKTKVLIGSDGVNSVVAKYIGFEKPVSTGRFAVRGLVDFKDGHDLGMNFMQLLGKGARYGIVPLDHHSVFWFFTYTPSTQEERDMEHDHAKLKQFAIDNLGEASEKQRQIVTNTELHNLLCSELRYRHPWDLIRGNIYKDNVCVIGDAFHPMTPDIGQGACTALEDSVVLARCIREAMKKKKDEADETWIKSGLEKFAKERRWRSIKVISLAYLTGMVQQGQGAFLSFLRDHLLAGLVLRAAFKLSMYDCGKLN